MTVGATFTDYFFLDSNNQSLLGANGLTKVQIGNSVFMYVCSEARDTITIYRLDGPTDPVVIQTIADGDNALYGLDVVIFSRHVQVGGRDFLMAVSYGDGGVTIFEIGNDGTLDYVSTTVDTAALLIATSNGQPEVVEIGGSTYLYVSGTSEGGISVFEVTSNGALVSVENYLDNTSTMIARPYELAQVNIAGKTFLLASGGGAEDGLTSFLVNADGTLTAIDAVTTTGLNLVNGVDVAQVDGATFVYGANRLGDSLVIYSMDAFGQMTLVTNILDDATLELDGALYVKTYEIGGQAYLMVTAFDDDGFTLFRIENNGLLTALVNLTDTAGNFLLSPGHTEIVEFEGVPYLYVSGINNSVVNVFRLDLPISVSYNGSTYEMAETLKGALEIAEAGAVVTMMDDSLYSATAEVVDVVRDNITVSTTAAADATFRLSGFAYNFTETGAGSVTVRGGGFGESISMGAGDDTIYGYAGDDTVSAGNGADRLYGGLGDDALSGGAAGDRLFGGYADDFLFGGGGADTAYGGRGGDEIKGGSGADLIEGDAGGDRLFGGAGVDFLIGGNGADTAYGDQDDDFIYGGLSDDVLYGGANGDQLFGGEGSDQLFGGGGGDTLDGAEGADTAVGGGGNDILSGEAGADLLFGGTGKDTAYGGAGDDTLDGGDSSDRLFADHGNDILFGGASGDFLYGGFGNDEMTGGAGQDRFYFLTTWDNDRILDFENNTDRLYINFVEAGYATTADMLAAVGSEAGGHVLLEFASGNKITIENMTLANIENDIINVNA